MRDHCFLMDISGMGSKRQHLTSQNTRASPTFYTILDEIVELHQKFWNLENLQDAAERPLYRQGLLRLQHGGNQMFHI